MIERFKKWLYGLHVDALWADIALGLITTAFCYRAVVEGDINEHLIIMIFVLVCYRVTINMFIVLNTNIVSCYKGISFTAEVINDAISGSSKNGTGEVPEEKH